jgi:hypothetical protein
VLLILVGMVAVLAACSLLVGRQPRRGQPRRTPDYAAMSEIESHDVDDMLDAIAEYRRRTGRRAVGEELADEFLRGGWDSDEM